MEKGMGFATIQQNTCLTIPSVPTEKGKPMADIKWEMSENGLDIQSPKEWLHIGSDGATLNLHNLTEEERKLVERYRDILENLIGIKIIIEEVPIDG